MEVDIRKSARENASTFFELSKKFSKKAQGCRIAMENAKQKLKELESKLLSQPPQDAMQKAAQSRIVIPTQSKKRKWYEGFKWFKTSGGRLAVGGRDAATNEILVKKHTETADTVFHADLAGSPFVILKDGGNAASEEYLEVARFVASHSRAWRGGLGSVDVYMVNPDQVSKTPPSGEYLTRGSFMIYGKKNYFRNTPLGLCIGFDGEQIICGPESAVSAFTKNFCEIIPGELSQSAAAKEILGILKSRDPEIQKLTPSPIAEIQRVIPAGKTRVVVGTGSVRRKSSHNRHSIRKK